MVIGFIPYALLTGYDHTKELAKYILEGRDDN